MPCFDNADTLSFRLPFSLPPYCRIAADAADMSAQRSMLFFSRFFFFFTTIDYAPLRYDDEI